MPDEAFGVFNRSDVVGRYDTLRELFASERNLFAEFVAPGANVVDLGVGSGRTTGELVAAGGRYVGVDIAPNMVAAARQAHPDADLRVGDATDLAWIADRSVDVVVFSFNGIDYIVDPGAREAALREIHRILVPGGRLIFSSHDPRAIIARRNPALGARAVAVAVVQTIRRTLRRMPTAAFWRGHGIVIDTIYGGTPTVMATPKAVRSTLDACGFRPLRCVPGPDGARGGALSTEWWYYVAERPGRVDAIAR